MSTLAQVYLLSSILVLTVGILYYGTHPNQVVNRIFLALCLVLFYRGFAQFEFYQTSDINLALLWLRFGDFWYLLPALELHYSIRYSNVRVRKIVLYCSTYVPVVLLSVFDALVFPYQIERQVPWGWEYHFVGYFGYVAGLWVLLLTVAALLILIRRRRDVKNYEEKTAIAYVFSGFLTPTVVGISAFAIPFFTSLYVPDLTVPAAAIGFLLVGYGILRHGMYILTAGAAAADILSTMADALFLVNPSGEIIVSNKAALKLLGYEASELAGKPLSLLTQDLRITEALLGHDPISGIELEVKTKQGDTIPVSVSESVIRTKRGNLVGCILIFRDVTERKEMERQLLNSTRLATIGKTTSMVSHDLRNPLQAMQSATSILRGKLDQTDRTTEKMLDLIEESIRRSNQIVSDLLDYSREFSLQIEESDPRTAVEAALSSLSIPGNIEIVNLTTQRPRIRVDVNRLERVFINLIQNAIDAMPEGGKLTISSKESEGNVEISFTDTGMGMTEETAKKVGTHLFTTKAKGMGLGLAICKRIVEAHKGSILIESAPDKGSTFTVELPVKGPDPLQPVTVSPPHVFVDVGPDWQPAHAASR